MSGRDVLEICKKCGKTFVLGVDGTDFGCDACTNVKRDYRGFAWMPGEMSKMLESFSTGVVRTVKRPRGI